MTDVQYGTIQVCLLPYARSLQHCLVLPTAEQLADVHSKDWSASIYCADREVVASRAQVRSPSVRLTLYASPVVVLLKNSVAVHVEGCQFCKWHAIAGAMHLRSFVGGLG